MEVVGFVGLFVVFSDVIDDLHVVLIQFGECVFACKLQGECVGEYESDFFSAF